jgi:hypothetical protein
MTLGRAMSIIRDAENSINDKNKAESEKDQSLESLNEKINLISKMNAFEYLHHINGEEDKLIFFLVNSKINKAKEKTILNKVDGNGFSFPSILINFKQLITKNIISIIVIQFLGLYFFESIKNLIKI